MEYQAEVVNYMMKEIEEWCRQNQHMLQMCANIDISTGATLPVTVRKYKPRQVPIKATEHERAVSRAYYIAHREEILEKRRLYNFKKYKSKNKNLIIKDHPKKS